MFGMCMGQMSGVTVQIDEDYGANRHSQNKIKTKMASDSDEPDLGWAVGLPEMDLHRRAKKR